MSDSYIQAVEKNIDAEGERTDEITRLRSEATLLREENARLLGALQPFADRLDELEKMKASKYACATSVEIEHLRAARAAIWEGGKDG